MGRRERALVVAALLGALGLGGCKDNLCEGAECVDGQTPFENPRRSDAGADPFCVGPRDLYRDGSCTELAEGVRFFQPRHVLYTDGSFKERYVYLPPNARIDTSDPDGWVFPVGTILFKNFYRDGVRVETRRMEKVSLGVGFEHWEYGAYVWNAAQDRAVEIGDHTSTPSGDDGTGMQDVVGTEHDIPSRLECLECHAREWPDMGVGFSAIQLNHDLVGLSLDDLDEEGRLTQEIDLVDAFLPGDAPTREALGYLHANCGHCHGQTDSTGTGLVMRALVGTSGLESTDLFATAVGVDSTWSDPENDAVDNRIEAGESFNSAILARMQKVDPIHQMPPLGRETVDLAGVSIVSTFIDRLDDVQ